MPSHKRKKKKKSHKRSKKYSSSSSEEDSCSPWRVSLSDADSDESNNQERLTPLVRRTYMNYLKQALTLNLAEWTENSNSGSDSESIEEMVHKWSSVLEQKAMRTCLISELYRTSMVSLIRQIKAKTSERKLYIEEKKLSRLKSKIPLNKGLQTEMLDFRDIKMCAVETQTDIPPSCLLELPLPKSKPSDRPYDPAIDFSDSESRDGGVSSSLGSKSHPPFSLRSGNQEICTISSTSDLLDVDQLFTEEDSINIGVLDNFCGGKSITLKSNENSQISKPSEKDPSEHSEDPSEVLTKNSTKTLEMFNSNSDTNVVPKKLIGIKKRQVNVVNTPLKPKDNLDKRLSALGLLKEDIEENLSQPTGKSKKSNWYAEEIAQSCNFARILMRMTTKQREKVLKSIKDLFGEDNGPLMELSEENITVCRKRIASVVVMELTPIYQNKRIASRYLFKYLAKKITKSIMDKSYAPDTKSIRWKVKKYFEDGKVIMSESDCI